MTPDLFYCRNLVTIVGTSRSNSAAAPHLALIAVQILFATWPIVGKIALRAVPAIALVGFRVAGAALTLLVLAKISGNLQTIERVDWSLLILSSILGLILNQLLFVKGLSLTTAINSTLLSTTIPVSILLVGVALVTDHVTWQRVLGIVLAAFGVFYLIGPGAVFFRHARRRLANRVELTLLRRLYRRLEGPGQAIQRAQCDYLDFCRRVRCHYPCRHN